MRQEPTFFLVGDSISIHYWPFLTEFVAPAWIPRQKEGTDEAMADLDIPKGANGGDSGMVLRYLSAALPSLEADLLLVNCGLHDIKRYPGRPKPQVDPAAYRENLRAIVFACRAKGLPLVWIQTTPLIDELHNRRQPEFSRFSADLEQYNLVAEEVMGAHGVPVIDLYRFTNSLGREELFCDHVHFTPEVRRLQAAHISGWLLGYRADLGEMVPAPGKPRPG